MGFKIDFEFEIFCLKYQFVTGLFYEMHTKDINAQKNFVQNFRSKYPLVADPRFIYGFWCNNFPMGLEINFKFDNFEIVVLNPIL